MKNALFLFLLLLSVLSYSQNIDFFLGKSYNTDINKVLYHHDSKFHTSFKPILKSNVAFVSDSVFADYDTGYSKWFLRKIFSEHFFILKGDDYEVKASPIIKLSIGKELTDDKNTFVNTRGYLIQGNLLNKFSFSTSFFENQAIFPNYLHDYIKENRIVPGQGYSRNFKEKGFDYAMSSGHVTYRSNDIFTVKFGHGKNFIGDGYRSLLLSDNSFNYPFLRLQTDFWKIQYTNLYAELMDINYFQTHSLPNIDQIGYPKKYLSLHYLSINITNKIQVSLFESVLWRMNHALGTKGFDVNYLNPIIMLRPIEYSLNSPDNVMLGLNTKYNIFKLSYLYGQFVLDEFSINDLKEKNGFWANKIGYQIGYKAFDFLYVPRLTFQMEYNFVRPYTYAHHNPQQNYGHYNQPLAHPLGANFSEFLFITNYKWKRFEIDAKIIFTKYGADIEGDSFSYGGNIYLSTGTFGIDEGLVGLGSGRPSDFGIDMYQGNLTKINFKSLNISYILNPKTNFKINLGVTLRNYNSDKNIRTQFINFGIVSDLFNYYYDI